MIKRCLQRCCVIVWCLTGFAIAGGQPPGHSVPDEKEKTGQTNLRKLIDESIHWYQLLPSEGSTDSMKPLVIMRWPNNIRGSGDGATVVWVANGRPEAVAAIYPWKDLFCHEFDSLSRGTIVAKHKKQIVWQPTEAGLKFRAIPDAPMPARSTAARLRQMKTIAKQFRSTLLGWKTDNSQREELRLLPRPIYRYKIEDPDELLDGALFAFVSGTDPESILVIEAFRVEGKYQWQSAFVRRSSGALEGRFRDTLVWTAKRHPPQKNTHSTHMAFSRNLSAVLQPKN